MMPGDRFLPSKNKRPKLIAVIGPTASGKTDLGCHLALRFTGEIVSADAKQVYRGMDIGTAKELDLPVPQHLVDIKNPGEKITVGEYQALAYEVIDSILRRGKLPILVGGSGLYVEAVTNGYVFKEAMKSREQKSRYQVLKLGIAWDRAVLKERIAKRVDLRLGEGMVEEVERLLSEGVSKEWLLRCGIEYEYLTRHLTEGMPINEVREQIIYATNQFMKRQYTWWRRHTDVEWISTQEDADAKVQSFIAE